MGEKPAAKAIFHAVVDSALSTPSESLSKIATDVLPTYDLSLDMDDPTIRHVLHLADLFIRYTHRHTIVEALLRHPAHLVANIDPSGPGRHPDAVVLPAQPFPRTLELLRHARATVVCQPNYPGALNERIVFAMQARCAVIMTPNPRTRQLFSHGDHLLFTEFDGANSMP